MLELWETVPLSIKEAEERRFYYADFGSEDHYRTTFRLWVHHKVVTFTDEGAPVLAHGTEGRVDEGKSDATRILRPDPRYWIAVVFCPCGYRGSSVITPTTSGAHAEKFWRYESPRGNLGVSEGALLVVPTTVDAVTVRWERTGRLYGAPASGTTIVYRDGRVEELPETDLCEIEDLGESSTAEG